MTTQLAKFLDHNEFEPWDLLFKDFFKTDSFFLPAINSKPNYPVDIYEDDKNAIIEIAAAGLDKEDIQIEEVDGLLKVSYNKKEEKNEEKLNYIQKGIAKRSFCLSWRFSDKYDLKKVDATMDKGILKIEIPKKEEKAIVKNTIKIK
jgi:HSP20 family protein